MERCENDSSLSNSWKKLILFKDSDLDFAGLERKDFHQTLLRAGEREVSVEDVENWLEENDSDHVYQVLSTEEIAESVLAGDQPGKSSSDSEDEVVVRLRMSQVRDCTDTLIQYADATNDRDIQGFYEHFRTLRELIIQQQHQRSKQLK